MALFSKLFGGSSKPDEPPKSEEYGGFRIYATPIAEGSAYRLSARIELDTPEGTKEHLVIRADTFGDIEEAKEISVAKAKQVIDEQGTKLFG